MIEISLGHLMTITPPRGFQLFARSKKGGHRLKAASWRTIGRVGRAVTSEPGRFSTRGDFADEDRPMFNSIQEARIELIRSVARFCARSGVDGAGCQGRSRLAKQRPLCRDKTPR